LTHSAGCGKKHFYGSDTATSLISGASASQKKLEPTTYWLRTGLTYSDKIWYGNTRGGVACSYWSATSRPEGGGTPAPQTFWTLLTCAHTVRVARFELDCPVLGRLVRLKFQLKPDTNKQIYTYVYRSRPSIFGFRTELGNRSGVSVFSTCRPGNSTHNIWDTTTEFCIVINLDASSGGSTGEGAIGPAP